jgi:hypothetical protein
MKERISQNGCGYCQESWVSSKPSSNHVLTLRRILPFTTKQASRPRKEPPVQPATELVVLFAPPRNTY